MEAAPTHAPETPTRARRARRLDVDLLRALAVLLVVMYHGGALVGGNPLGWPQLWTRSFGSCCVPVFFFVSGLLNSGRERPVRHWLRKAASCVALVAFWGMVAALWFQLRKHDPFSLEDALTSFVTFRQQETNWLWFLYAMAVPLLAAPVLLRVQASSRELWKALVVVTLVGTFGFDALSSLGTLVQMQTGSEALSQAYSWIDGFDPFRTWRRFVIGYFVLGMVVAEPRAARRIASLPMPLCVAGVVLAPIPHAAYGYASILSAGYYDTLWSGYGTIGTAVLVVCLYALAQRLAPHVPKAVAWLATLVGSESLAVYLLHWFVVNTGKFQSYWSLTPRFAPRLLLGFVLCSALVLVCALVGHALRKTPLRRLLSL